jgi:hypothetical protein
MNYLAETVSINRRFARSARIDTDLNGTPPLVGYVLQASVAKALETMTASQCESHQGAYTWTGPYGGGKSSAALLVANLVAGESGNRKIAQEIAGDAIVSAFVKAFPENEGNWSVVAVTGSRCALRNAIAEGATATFGWDNETLDEAISSDTALIDALESASDGAGGTLLILDELGKLLEHEAGAGGDIHLLQDIAERASRSEGRLVVIGILHQSFDQYAARAARDSRKEWAKVQGRYQDIAFLSGADETVALLGQAISATKCPDSARLRAESVAAAVAERRPTDPVLLADGLCNTWPLNPVTALLLGPVSRQRFAQNERSLFGFLSSAEPCGFQQFLASTSDYGLDYGPALLWDYLAANFGMALANGNDGSRFSLAFEAIERAGAKGSALHVAITKSAAVIELFRNGSGLALADDFLRQAVCGVDEASLTDVIKDLLDWAILIRQPRLGGYALFAGSDFDLEEAINRAIAPLASEQLASLPQKTGFSFATAKRHYFRTGVLRTFEIKLYLVGRESNATHICDSIAAHPPRGSGIIALLINDGGLTATEIDALAKASAKKLNAAGIIGAVAGAIDSYALRESAAELFAVERVFRDHPQLEGDRIARREIASRQSACIDLLHRNLEITLGTVKWWLAPTSNKARRDPLTLIASALADYGFPNTPILKSELLQRDKPSSNAMGALRDLCHAMVLQPEAVELGIKGYPAEKGLYLTLLKPFGIHRSDENGLAHFAGPHETDQGRSLQPAWSVLDNSPDITAGAIYDTWSKPPYGMKAGVMPVIFLAYLMANSDRVAAYIDGMFQTGIDDVFVDKLLQRPADIRLRHIDRSVREAAFLSGLAHHFDIDQDGQSLPVAAALFQAFELLPAYSLRTNVVSEATKQIRNAITTARDPEALLFDALPLALGDALSPEPVIEALRECQEAYPALLVLMRNALARALGVDVASFAGLAERAEAVHNLTNDYNFDAFAKRAAAFETGDDDIEGLVSLLVHRPAQSWSDRDREQALVEMAGYGRRFRELEALAVVRNRRSHTEAVALVVGIDPLTPPLLHSFELTDLEKKAASALADHVLVTLQGGGKNGHIKMAALARAVASLAAEAA